MRVVIGIGNPGKKYSFTRHNAGFLLLDYFAEKSSVTFKASKQDYYFAEGKTGDAGFSLIKPSTFVNNTGIAALQVLEEYQIPLGEMLVLTDDVNLPSGEIRVRVSGGSGGHNGLKSVIYHLNSDDFPRIRIGIGAEFRGGEMADYVLSPFTDDEFKEFKASFDKGVMLIEEFIKGGTDAMLNLNSRMKKPTKENPPEQPPSDT